MNGRKKNIDFDINKLDRLQMLFFVMVIMFLFIIIKLFSLQVLEKKIYTSRANSQHSFVSNIKPRRGEIFIETKGAKNKYPLAINKDFFKLYAIPNLIKDPLSLSKKLAEILEMDEETLIYRLGKKDDIYEPIKSKLSDKEIKKVSELREEGLNFTKENFRYYPDSEIGSHIVGFVGYNDDKLVGSYGLEGYWENELKGEKKVLVGEKDVYGNQITISKNDFTKVENGSDLYLTIDQAIQHFSCKALKESVEKYEAENGTVIVVNPKNGDILSMCNYPEFDPNNYSKVESGDVYNNDAVFRSYEPGSVFKAMTMAMGLDLELIKPESSYNDTGEYEVEDYVIRNSDLKSHGMQTMVQILDESLNTGAAYVAEKVGHNRFLDYAKKFGFGKKTGIDLSVEVNGNLDNLNRKGRVFLATASYGQGITATPIQLAMAFSSFANGGYLYKPRIVKKVIYSDGKEEEIEPELIRKVISDRAAKQISAMLVSVIESGHASLAKVDEYYLGGKTGTAQIASRGGYSKDRANHTFIGFGPSRDPRFVIYTKFDSPKRAWAALSAAPLFGEISEFILDYYKIKPER